MVGLGILPLYKLNLKININTFSFKFYNFKCCIRLLKYKINNKLLLITIKFRNLEMCQNHESELFQMYINSDFHWFSSWRSWWYRTINFMHTTQSAFNLTDWTKSNVNYLRIQCWRFGNNLMRKTFNKIIIELKSSFWEVI